MRLTGALRGLHLAGPLQCVAPSPEPKRVRLRCKSDVRQALIGAHLNEHPDGIERCALLFIHGPAMFA